MKKRLLIKLVLCFVFVFVFIGCSESNKSDEQDFLGIQLTNEEAKIARFYDYNELQYSMKYKIDGVKDGSYKFYLVDINMSDAYFVCGYGDSDYKVTKWLPVIEDFKWFKFNDKKDIVDSYGDLNLKYIVAIGEAKITYDLIENKELNISIQYRDYIMDEYFTDPNFDINKLLENNDIGANEFVFWTFEPWVTMMEGYVIGEEDYINCLNYYIDDNGEKQIYFNADYYITGTEENPEKNTKIKDTFKEYYDYFEPYFIKKEELFKYEELPDGKQGCTTVVSIELFKMFEIVKQINELN